MEVKKGTRKGYIFLCSKATERECFQKMLFGGKKSYQSKVKHVNIGDSLFLYNYETQALHGRFLAFSESKLNIDPDAWKGRYPFQVKIKWASEYEPITKIDFEHILFFRNGYPTPVLNEEQLEELENIFTSSLRLPAYEVEYRNQNPPTIITKDGHRVRSKDEKTIDDWLYDHWIIHEYETKVPIEDPMFCDFCIPNRTTNERVYIEYWGKEDDAYTERRKDKTMLYKENGLKLVQLLPKDLKNLDGILSNIKNV